MRRRTSKSRAAGSGLGATGQEAAELPSVSWEELLSRAEAALDEKGVEVQERRRASAERTVQRMADRGVVPSWDVEGVKRALAAYYADYVLGEAKRGFRRVFADCGVPCSDFLDARDSHPEFRLVFDYIQRQGKNIAGIEASEMGRQAQASQKRLVTEEGCELNQRAVELSLKAALPDVYGDSEAAKGGEKGRQIVYKFENLTANFIMSPGELAAKKLNAATPVSDIIYG